MVNRALDNIKVDTKEYTNRTLLFQPENFKKIIVSIVQKLKNTKFRKSQYCVYFEALKFSQT
jgi:hypothetical protein